jgi:microcystin degradation protein MlrC
LDIEELGLAVTVVHEDAARAAREAERLADLAWELRHEFDIKLYSVQEVVDIALNRQTGQAGQMHGPLVVSDSADATGAGSPGDSNAVLKQMLELGVQDRLTCLLCLVDPQAVAQGIEAGIGSHVVLQLGYYMEKNYGQPIAIEGIVTKIGIGTFKFGTGFQANLQGNMGRCIVFEVGLISVLIMENPTFTIDPAMYRCMGLEPSNADLVMVKSAAQFRSCYEHITSQMFILDTPGSSTPNLRTLDFRKVQRPFYPFDDHFVWKS